MDPFGNAMLEEVMLFAAMTAAEETRSPESAATPVRRPAAPEVAPAQPAKRQAQGRRLFPWRRSIANMPAGEPEHPYGS